VAEEVQIQGSGEAGKLRHPLGILGLMIITLGIYHFVWYYKINKEMAALGRARGTDECGTEPGTSLLALVPGFLIIVPPYLSFYNASKRLNAAERLTGRQPGMEPGLMLLLYILLSPIAIYLMQSNFNKVLRQQATGTPAAPLPGGPEAPPPPATPPGTAPGAALGPEAPPAPGQRESPPGGGPDEPEGEGPPPARGTA
jgi:Domain of unknown function (DUF4234)